MEQLGRRLESRLHEASLPLAISLWNGQSIAGREPCVARLHLKHPSTAALLADPSLSRIAESYVNGDIDVEGTMRDVVRCVAQMFADTFTIARRRYNVGALLPRSRERDREAIAHHYDVSNDFYALWLDRHRVYSCAYFRSPDDSLDQAQEQKLEHICRKLCLREGESLLDIGCGWGGLIFWAAVHHGARCVGITLSTQQYEYVQAEIARRGLAGQVEVRLQNYRDIPPEEQFDKIASVGMFEHVGVRAFPAYFGAMYSHLKPGGIALNHGITSLTFDNEEITGGGRDFISKYVFPDGELQHLARVIEPMARAGFEVLDVESLRRHYALTLWHWVKRLEASAGAACELVGERRYRIWRTYMAGFAYAFEQGWDNLYQITAAKPDANKTFAYPLTRDHIYIE